MMLSEKAIGKRFGLLAALVAALVIACTGVVFAQSSTAYPGYEKPNPVDADPVTNASTAAGDVSTAARVPNGGFETGDFSDWRRANRSEVGEIGNWFVYSGTESPLFGMFILPAPPEGDFAATTDQFGPGSHVLYRNIKLAPGMRHELSFYLYYHNFNNRFFTPNTLDDALYRRNQQYRVDVLKPTANPFSVDPDDILATIFRTEVGDPNELAPTLLTFGLTRFAGKTVRLRFAEVDNQTYFLASVDKVKVTSERR
jgi:hypothetical protein